MHCISQTSVDGGETLLVDGFQVAEQLRTTRPDYFNILASSRLHFYQRISDFTDFYTMARHTTIEYVCTLHARDSVPLFTLHRTRSSPFV